MAKNIEGEEFVSFLS
jgi:hypothetical protein